MQVRQELADVLEQVAQGKTHSWQVLLASSEKPIWHIEHTLLAEQMPQFMIVQVTQVPMVETWKPELHMEQVLPLRSEAQLGTLAALTHILPRALGTRPDEQAVQKLGLEQLVQELTLQSRQVDCTLAPWVWYRLKPGMQAAQKLAELQDPQPVTLQATQPVAAVKKMLPMGQEQLLLVAFSMKVLAQVLQTLLLEQTVQLGTAQV